MGTINSKLNNLKESDIWSFILFALFKMREIPEYSAISELAYILDKTNLINLCEYFGGLTITIPTIEELEITIQSLIVYQYIEVDKLTYDEAVAKINISDANSRKLKNAFIQIKDVLNNYSLKTRG